ncbi:MAG: TIGR02757 family protein [Spirochaetales bacterium]|nr:TIGR02757 family protein [Spirochaetales bacterium]
MKRYPEPADREVAGLACAVLALGGVAVILRSAETVLETLGERPARKLAETTDASLRKSLDGFRHRFFDGGDMAALLGAVRELRREAGGLESAFLPGDDATEPDYVEAASALARAIEARAPRRPDGKRGWPSNLLPDPARGSASKRTFMFLRWMVRRDAVDPGGWDRCDPARLVVPLDTHMGAACRALGLLSRKADDLKAAREATAAFRLYNPGDPARWDFALTRPGIHPRLVSGACFDRLDERLAYADDGHRA